MVKKVTLLLILGSLTLLTYAQQPSPDSTLPYYVISADSMVVSRIHYLQPVVIIENPFNTAEDRRMFRLTKYRINKVYPYAMMAIEKMEQTEEELAEIKKKRKQKKYLKNEHSDLKDEYADFLKDFTVEEGRILIKIIERHTGEPFYDLIKKYRNGITATYWNTLANTQGYSLKDGYDPHIEKYMEVILSAMDE